MLDFSKLDRKSLNGYETTIAMHTLAPGDWRWELIRYPADADRWREPTETVFVLPRQWTASYIMIEQYLAEHPEDGFASC